MKEEITPVIVGSFQISGDIPNGRSIVFSGHVTSIDSIDEINEQVDMFMSIINRQRAKYEIEIIEVKLFQKQQALEQQLNAKKETENALNKLTTKQESGKKLSSAEGHNLTQLQNALSAWDTNIPVCERDVEKVSEELARVKGMAA
jgi:hypothetical protein